MIETERLHIRPYADEDAVHLYNMTQEPGHFDYMPDVPPANIDDIKKLITWSKGCNQKNTREKIYKFNLSVFLKETGEYIGICGLGPNDANTDEVELYYSLMREYQGFGYAKEAAQALLSYAFETICLPRVVGIVHPDNKPSVQIIQGLGMTYVKVLQGLDGELKDMNGYQIYEVLNEPNR